MANFFLRLFLVRAEGLLLLMGRAMAGKAVQAEKHASGKISNLRKTARVRQDINALDGAQQPDAAARVAGKVPADKEDAATN
ncbi:MAG: hypothetical protein E6X23_07225 [Mixta calida]|uniref:hypothetical protein n=2 Tax=Erwiniaceae TaxID=1903409 RepID=UPI00258E8499|nr:MULTISPECIES: hypothetical protein [Mixta]MCR1566039.1 hypothetical protein [Mixta sp.]MDU4290433.1 hypothetical protein [Mixta calida]MDU4941311.1 hypothetical protein [Mixta calida]